MGDLESLYNRGRVPAPGQHIVTGNGGSNAQVYAKNADNTRQPLLDPGRSYPMQPTSAGLSSMQQPRDAMRITPATVMTTFPARATALVPQHTQPAPPWNGASMPTRIGFHPGAFDEAFPSSPYSDAAYPQLPVEIPMGHPLLSTAGMTYAVSHPSASSSAVGILSSYNNGAPQYHQVQDDPSHPGINSSSTQLQEIEAYVGNTRPNNDLDNENSGGAKGLSEDGVPKVSCGICQEPMTGDYARGNLQRHLKTKHSDVVLQCEVEGCNDVFHRSDYRLRHYRSKHQDHPELSSTPRLRGRVRRIG